MQATRFHNVTPIYVYLFTGGSDPWGGRRRGSPPLLLDKLLRHPLLSHREVANYRWCGVVELLN